MTLHRGWLLVSLTLVVLLTACSFAAAGSPAGAPAARSNDAQGAAPTAQPATGQTDDAEGLAARVNGAPITLEAFQSELARERTSREALGLFIPEPAAFEREVLDQLIEAMLIEQSVLESGITLSEEELDAQVAQSIAEAGGAESWAAWLAMSNLTEPEYRAQLRLQLLGGMMTAQIAADVPATAEQVHARHILVETEAGAQNILSALQGGANFAELALQHSIDLSTREAGGDLAWFARGQLLEPEVEATAFALQPGEISGVVVSKIGYHVVQTLERDPARPLDEAARQAMIERAIEEWTASLWESAEIERYISAEG
ncbi:MAG: peptidylprolyl isomerase [Anaerolineae bacterium]|nr:peptidylprolyl isomerase [Anaerolineae bacterium]